MTHYKEYYDCGEHIYRQCRCPGGTKTVTSHPCPSDQHKEKEEEE